MYMTLKQGDAESRYYAYTGGREFDAARPVVIFIHGAQNDHSVWILQSRYLAHHGYAVLALDLPGHGRSSGPALASVEQMADWLLALLDSLGISHAALIGHSMGSLIALESACRQPARISRLIMVGSAYPMKVSAQLLDAAQNDLARAIDMINIWSHSGAHGGFSHKPSNPGPGFSIIWGGKRLMQRIAAGNGADVLHTDFSACNAYANGEAAAASVTCPALFVLGEKDAMTMARSGSALAKRIASSTTRILPGVGHALMGEAPDAVLNAIKEFLPAA